MSLQNWEKSSDYENDEQEKSDPSSPYFIDCDTTSDSDSECSSEFPDSDEEQDSLPEVASQVAFEYSSGEGSEISSMENSEKGHSNFQTPPSSVRVSMIRADEGEEIRCDDEVCAPWPMDRFNPALRRAQGGPPPLAFRSLPPRFVT